MSAQSEPVWVPEADSYHCSIVASIPSCIMHGLYKTVFFCSVYCAEDTFDGKFSMKSAAANLDANAETGGASRARGQKARAHANNQNNQNEAPARPHDQRSDVQNADVQTTRASQGDQGADAQPFGPEDVQEPQLLLETSAEASTSATAMMTVLGLYDYVPGVGRSWSWEVGECKDRMQASKIK